jgi:two-component system, LytTR family, response regulator AlgR
MDLLIVDDESLARERLSRMVQRLDGYQLVAEAANAQTAMAAMREHDPDVVLCDIRMPGQDGLQLAQQISEMEDPPAVIFCTAYDEYALDAFGVQAVDYLLKPVGDDQLQAALEKAQKVNRVQLAALAQAEQPQTDNRTHISARTRRGVELIPIDSIHYFLADQKYVTVYHDETETLIDDTLKELEQEFPERFVRVHRNALVAIKSIEGMERTPQGQHRLRLKGVDVQPIVSRRHVTPLREFLSRL